MKMKLLSPDEIIFLNAMRIYIYILAIHSIIISILLTLSDAHEAVFHSSTFFYRLTNTLYFCLLLIFPFFLMFFSLIFIIFKRTNRNKFLSICTIIIALAFFTDVGTTPPTFGYGWPLILGAGLTFSYFSFYYFLIDINSLRKSCISALIIICPFIVYYSVYLTEGYYTSKEHIGTFSIGLVNIFSLQILYPKINNDNQESSFAVD